MTFARIFLLRSATHCPDADRRSSGDGGVLGSVSAVTFTAAMTFMERGDHPVEGFMAWLRGRGHAMNDLVPFGRAR